MCLCAPSAWNVRAVVVLVRRACAERSWGDRSRGRAGDQEAGVRGRSALAARTLKTIGAGALGGSISSTLRVRARARRPRRGEAGGSCRSSRLGGGAWVRPLGYKIPLYSSDDPCGLNWRAASGAVRSCAKLVLEYFSSSTSRRVKFVVCVSEFSKRAVR